MRARRLLQVLAVAATLLAPRAEAVRSAVRVYTAREGLPQLQPTALCQDRMGFLWVGTRAGGVGRYDGRRFEITDAANGLPGSSVRSLSLGPGGEVLVATTNGGAVFADGTWKTLPETPGPSPAVYALLALPDGRLYAGSSGGLFVAARIGAPFEAVAAVGGLAGSEVGALLRTPDGVLWAGTARGLARLLPGGALTRFEATDLPQMPATVLAPGRAGGLLVGVTERGLYEVDPVAAVARRIGDDEAPGRNVSAVVREAEGGGVWIGTSDRGAFQMDAAGTFERFGVPEGLPDARVWTAFEDREGIVWLGTDSGLVKRGPGAFRTLGAEDGIPPGVPLFGIAETPDGALWFGAHERGILRRAEDGTARLFTVKDGLPHRAVRAICVTPGGDVLVMTPEGAATISGNRVTPFRLPDGAPKAIDEVAFATDGSLLLGSGRQGLFIVRDGKLSRAGKPVGDSVSALFVGHGGTIWVAGPGWGVAGLKEGAPPETLGLAEGLPSSFVTSVLEDRRGGLWVATDRGLFWRTLDRRTRVLDYRSGLPDSFVYWVGEDREGFVWAGTNRGAARIAPSGEIRVFTTNDGLGADECNEDGFFVDSKGRVWISTEGLSFFKGLPAPRRSVPPLVAVSEVRVGHEKVSPAREVRLPSKHEPVTFRYSSLSFLDEGATTFRYRLVGLSDSWTAAEPGQSETTYGALGPGQYVFEVTATTVDGRSPESPVAVRVVVDAPWWRRSSVIASEVLLFLAAAALVVRARERRLVAARRHLEELVAVRTEELRKLNAQLSELAITDSLTGLPNRRSILDSAEEAFSLARRRGLPYAVAMIDFDHFKQINDTLGHAEGDRILVESARRMVDCLRTEDIVGRYGGEEFLAAFPMTDQEGALAVGERLRRAVSGVRLPPPSPEAVRPERVTVSVGVASLLDADKELGDLLKRADAALYAAKQAGRNRVVFR